jgi:hypothetical protein
MIDKTCWEEKRHGQDCRSQPQIRTCNVITARNADEFAGFAAAGLSFRKPTAGPEYNLVEEYVESQLPAAPRGQERTVFLEPEIDSGFPDAVAVYWHVSTAKSWSAARSELTKVDVRVAHFLAMAGASSLDALRPFFNQKSVLRSLDRLRCADIIRGASKTWRLRSLLDVFAVRRLVAIEAKIDQWRNGLHQAVQNTWFASESFLLVPRVSAGSDLPEEARRVGVGVRTRNQKLDELECPARRDRIPKSYASWLFNEWAWRAAMRV